MTKEEEIKETGWFEPKDISDNANKKPKKEINEIKNADGDKEWL